MATVTRNTTWNSGDVLTAAALNAEFDGLLAALALANDDISAGAGIVYSKLALTGSIVNADISSSAAIDVSKIATGLSGNLVGVSDTQTLTNKRITKRVGTTASSATPTPNSDTDDVYTVTALAAGATFGAPSGTPTNGQSLVIRIKDNGTARALDFNAAYRFSSDLAKPITTILGKTLYMGFMWNSTDSKWDCLAILNNF